jgi:Cu-Zn family superoxide dismutase
MKAAIVFGGSLLAAAAFAACATQEEGGPAAGAPAAAAAPPVRKAIAWINPKSDSQLAGSAIFLREAGGITLQVKVEQAPPGEHAVHIHETGDCSAPDGSSAGGHWNPTVEDHGRWGVAPHHLGDIGNLVVGEDGNGTLTLTTDRWSMGTGEPNDILDLSVIVHASPDDFTTQPTGAAGGRIGCGVIRAQ